MSRRPGLKVLVVDDDPIVRQALQIRLRGWGHEVLQASDARSALLRVDREAPDVVVSDVVLPGLSGLELLRRLKADDETLPVFIATAHAVAEVAADAMRDGAEVVLAKPLDAGRLQSLLEDALVDRVRGSV